MADTVTTARAAEIVGIGYEGLRSYLKRGLLGASGCMPPFVGRDTPAPDLSKMRAGWSRFGFVDLCLMRLAKQLIDLGLSFDQANGIISNQHLRNTFNQGAPAGAALLVWPPYMDFIPFTSKDDLRYLAERLSEAGPLSLIIQLDQIGKYVRNEMELVSQGQHDKQSAPIGGQIVG